MKIDPLEDLVFQPIKMQETQSKLSDWLPKKVESTNSTYKKTNAG